MVIRAALLVLPLLLLSACPTGTTCGRGRCQQGTCIKAVETSVARKDLSLDWWCVVPCSGELGCEAAHCLQSPIESQLLVCASDTIEVKYTVARDARLLFRDETVAVTSLSITGAHAGDGGVISCGEGEVCSAGWFKSGEFLPQVTAITPDGRRVNAPNGTPGMGYPPSSTAGPEGTIAPLGPLLPTGLPIVVHVGGQLDAL